MASSQKIKIIVAAALVVVAAVYLVYRVAQSSWAYCYSVDDFVASALAGGGSGFSRAHLVRLGGRVAADGIIRRVEDMQLDFTLTGARKSIPVRYWGLVPANFSAGKEVIVEGLPNADGIFLAQRIMMRCESKYKRKL